MRVAAWRAAFIKQVRTLSVQLVRAVRHWVGHAVMRRRHSGAGINLGRAVRRRYAIGAASREELDTALRERPSWHRRWPSFARRPRRKAA